MRALIRTDTGAGFQVEAWTDHYWLGTCARGAGSAGRMHHTIVHISSDPSMSSFLLTRRNCQVKMSSISELEVVPLGGGQEVGRSCILVRYKGTTVMLDCGRAASMKGKESLPMISELGAAGGKLERFPIESIDALLVSHFHVDHAAAIPYITEQIRGFSGKVFATDPTIAVLRLTLSDSVRVERAAGGGVSARTSESLDAASGAATKGSSAGGHSQLFDEEDVVRCMRRIQAVQFRERVEIARGDLQAGDARSKRSSPPVSATFYHAGHVLGAAMILLDFGTLRVLYTGDWTGSEDRHLMAADFPVGTALPDVIIGESTTGVRVLESRQARERRFCQSVESIVARRGRCLLPSSAVGRAQELLLILDELWSANPRLRDVPLLYCSRQSKQSLDIYGTYSAFMNNRIQAKVLSKNPWKLSHAVAVRSADEVAAAARQGPCVAVVAPGFLHTGASRQLLEAWAEHRSNGVVITGFNPEGTMARELLGRPREIQAQRGGAPIKLSCSVEEIPFMAHADFNENWGLIQAMGMPKTVVLVHGEVNEMTRLQDQLRGYYRSALEAQCRANGEPMPTDLPYKIVSPGNLTVVQRQYREDQHVSIRGMLASGAIAALSSLRHRSSPSRGGGQSSTKKARAISSEHHETSSASQAGYTGSQTLALVGGMEGTIVSRASGSSARQLIRAHEAGQESALHQSRLWNRCIVPSDVDWADARALLRSAIDGCREVWAPAQDETGRLQCVSVVIEDSVRASDSSDFDEWGTRQNHSGDPFGGAACEGLDAHHQCGLSICVRKLQFQLASSDAVQTGSRPVLARDQGMKGFVVEWEAGGTSDSAAEIAVGLLVRGSRGESAVSDAGDSFEIASASSSASYNPWQAAMQCCLPTIGLDDAAQGSLCLRITSVLASKLILALGQSHVSVTASKNQLSASRGAFPPPAIECLLPGVAGQSTGVMVSVQLRNRTVRDILPVSGDHGEQAGIVLNIPGPSASVCFPARWILRGGRMDRPAMQSRMASLGLMAEITIKAADSAILAAATDACSEWMLQLEPSKLASGGDSSSAMSREKSAGAANSSTKITAPLLVTDTSSIQVSARLPMTGSPSDGNRLRGRAVGDWKSQVESRVACSVDRYPDRALTAAVSAGSQNPFALHCQPSKAADVLHLRHRLTASLRSRGKVVTSYPTQELARALVELIHAVAGCII